MFYYKKIKFRKQEKINFDKNKWILNDYEFSGKHVQLMNILIKNKKWLLLLMIKLKSMNLSSISLGKSKNGRILLRIYTLLEFNR